MRISRTLIKALPIFASTVVVVVGLAPSALAATGNFNDGNKVVGTSFAREANEVYCLSGKGCYFDAHFPLVTCSKVASSRLRFQRDLLPDNTAREYDNFSSCTNYYWDNFHSGDTHGHHLDGKVTVGTGTLHFFYTDSTSSIPILTKPWNALHLVEG